MSEEIYEHLFQKVDKHLGKQLFHMFVCGGVDKEKKKTVMINIF